MTKAVMYFLQFPVVIKSRLKFWILISNIAKSSPLRGSRVNNSNFVTNKIVTKNYRKIVIYISLYLICKIFSFLSASFSFIFFLFIFFLFIIVLVSSGFQFSFYPRTNGCLPCESRSQFLLLLSSSSSKFSSQNQLTSPLCMPNPFWFIDQPSYLNNSISASI